MRGKVIGGPMAGQTVSIQGQRFEHIHLEAPQPGDPEGRVFVTRTLYRWDLSSQAFVRQATPIPRP